MPIPPGLQDVLETLDFVPDRSERIQYLISLAEQFKRASLAKPYAEESRVPGCESEAFVFVKPRTDGTLDYEFAVENPQGVSAMALATILQSSFSGAKSEDITQVPDEIVYKIFGEELSMGKSLGLMNMVRMAKRLAIQK